MVQIVDFTKNSENQETKEVISQNPLLSWNTIFKRSEDIQKHCEDFVVEKANTHNVMLSDTAGLTYIPTDGSDEIRQSQLSKFSFNQLCNKIGVPSNYIEKCVRSGRISLAQANVNSWLEDYNKDILIREHRGVIRGILSSKYSVCDTPEILDVLNDTLNPNYKVKGYFLSPERFHLRLVGNPLDINGEDLFAGISVDSSDVGRSPLVCNFFVYKQVCTNGLVVSKGSGTLFRQRHIGIDTDEFRNGLSSSLSLIPDIIASVTDSIKNKMKLNVVGRFSEIDALIARLKADVSLSHESSEKVINLMRDKYSNSMWGMINSITEVAQDFSLERRIELERYAGNLLIA